MSHKLTLEEFINRANILHEGLYDYSKAIYINNRTKVEIICPTHGPFYQTPNHHLQGHACKECGWLKIGANFVSNLREFLRKAEKRHDNFYEYTKSVYVNDHTSLIITCPTHGDFKQTPNMHLQGHGCRKCGFEKVAQSTRWTTEEFTQKAIKQHGDLYDYSMVNYVNSITNIMIICKKHGPFYQTPNHHLQGHACKECGWLKIGANFVSNLREFLRKAEKRHDNFYEYTKSVYVNDHTSLIITCPTHGDFKQTPNMHLQGHGCRKCGFEKVAQSTRWTTEEFTQKAIKQHGDLYDYSMVNYVNSITNIMIICKKHGPFSQQPHAHTIGVGCPVCSYSKAEKELLKYFVDSHINNKQQYSFKNLVGLNGGSLKFDFALCDKEDNILFLLEYQGQQHYRLTGWMMNQEEFETLQKHDKLKYEYCKNNNIPLEYISYKDNAVEMFKSIYKKYERLEWQ